MRFVYFSDTHLRSSVPACRKDDDFYSVQFDKLKQINKMIEEREVDYVLHGGDLFDSHDPSLQLVHDFVCTLNYAKAKSKAKWIINPGNHDIFGETTETITRSGLGILNVADVARVMNEVTDLELGNSVVRFIPRGFEKDQSLFFFPKIEHGKVYLLVPHMMLTNHWVIYPHQEIKDFKTNADIVLCSDFHGQFKERHGNTTFLNAGPLTRQSINEKNISPSVVYIDTEAHEAKILQLKFDPAEKVMDLSQEEPVEKAVAGDFLEALRSSTFEAKNRQDLVRKVGAETKASDLVVEVGVRRVQEAESMLEV